MPLLQRDLRLSYIQNIRPRAVYRNRQASKQITNPSWRNCDGSFVCWDIYSIFKKSPSDITFTPSSRASLNFEPGFSPTTTKSVLEETEPETLPPFLLILAFASSRDNDDKVPVRTKVLPEKTPASFLFSGFWILTFLRSLFSVLRFPDPANQFAKDCDTTGPTFLMASKSSRPAERILSMEPKCRATSSAVSSPTCGIERDTNKRAKVTFRAFSTEAKRLSADFSPKRGSESKSPFSSEKMSDEEEIRWFSKSKSIFLGPRCSISNACFPAK